MGKIEKLEEALYQKENKDIKKRAEKKPSFLGTLQNPPVSWKEEDKKTSEASPERGAVLKSFKDFFMSRMFVRLLWLGLGVVVVIGAAAFIFFYLGTRGIELSINVKDHGPATAGDIYTIPITLKNTSATNLSEIQITTQFPKGTLIRQGEIDSPAPANFMMNFPDLKPGESQTEEVAVRFFGNQGDVENTHFKILYKPENLKARFGMEADKTFIIGQVPLAVTWSIPSQITSGQKVSIQVNYSSNSSYIFPNIFLRLDFPSGFNFVSATPTPAVNNMYWNLGDLAPRQSGTISIQGTLSGNSGENKAFQGSLGVYDQIADNWAPYNSSSQGVNIVLNPLSVQETMSGSRQGVVHPGDLLSFDVHYQNNTQSSLKNVFVKTFLTGSILELNSLSIGQGGVFDAIQNAVVWGPSNVAALQNLNPGDQGDFTFTIRARPTPIVGSQGDQNLTLLVRSHIETSQIPSELAGISLVSDDSLEFKVASKTTISSRAIFFNSPLPNSGPLPPKVGQKTTYTIILEVKNFTNDIDNALIRVPIPPNVTWENAIYPLNSGIIFDPSSGQVKWSLGKLKAGTGVISPSLVGEFKVSITPGSSDIGQSVTLINQPILTGIDSFTGENVSLSADSKNITLLDDPSSQAGQWQVVP